MSAHLKTKKFSCVKCGELIEVHAPDSVHKTASRRDETCGHSVKVEHKCKNCGHSNIIYWCDIAWLH